jgi:nicotinamidase-related amidase
MNTDQLFDLLDLDQDGKLSRKELRDAAQRLRWHWQQAPIYAVLDFLTIRSPLSKAAFISCMDQIIRDAHGPYGQVLRQGPETSKLVCSNDSAKGPQSWPEARGREGNTAAGGADFESDDALSAVELLEDIEGHQAAADYGAVLEQLDWARPALWSGEAALLIIDPQRSFSSGAWMRSIGQNAEHEVMPIRLAFNNCARLLRAFYQSVEVMFTRCPFPPASYDWDEGLDGIVAPAQLYFVKPGNSAMWPPSNGYRQWVEGLRKRGKKTLVMGGCTLNSCLRVSAIETQTCLQNEDLEVVVDLSLCGARTQNYLKSPLFNGMSSVESAIREMTASGVTVVDRVAWR